MRRRKREKCVNSCYALTASIFFPYVLFLNWATHHWPCWFCNIRYLTAGGRDRRLRKMIDPRRRSLKLILALRQTAATNVRRLVGFRSQITVSVAGVVAKYSLVVNGLKWYNTISKVKFHDFFWREIFHEMFWEIFLKYFRNFKTRQYIVHCNK